MFLFAELQNLGHATTPKSRTATSCENTLMDEWDKLDQIIIDKVVGDWRKRL